MTAANTDAEVGQLIDVLGELHGRFELAPARGAEAPAGVPG